MLLLGAATPAGAQSTASQATYNRFEITPFAGWMAGGEFEDTHSGAQRGVDDAASFGVMLDVAADPNRHYEFLFSRQRTAVGPGDSPEGVDDAPLDMDIHYLHLGGTVNLPPDGPVVPFVAATLGATHFSPDFSGLRDATRFSLGLGGGLKVPVTTNVGLRFDARAHLTLFDTDADIFCVSAPPVAECRIRARSDSFVQYSVAIGLTVGF